MLETDPAAHPLAPIPVTRPEVTYAYIKQVWTAGSKQLALQNMFNFRQYLLSSPHNNSRLMMLVRVILILTSQLLQGKSQIRHMALQLERRCH